jgi:hypothetical protein
VEVRVYGTAGERSLGGMAGWELPAAQRKHRTDLPSQHFAAEQPVRVVRAAAAPHEPFNSPA